MKKNIAMRVAAFLFILTMISTCAFATTFAKYATSGETSDVARVAKWGVVVNATGADTLFASQYNEGKVKSLTSEDVVAPGTSGSLADFTVSGSPEVAVNVTYSADLELVGWEIESEEYCPIVITINGNDYAVGEDTIDTIEDLETAVENAIAAQSKSVAVGTPITGTLNVSWSWAYSTSADNDVKDTKLGNLATAPTIQLDVTCIVVQAA